MEGDIFLLTCLISGVVLNFFPLEDEKFRASIWFKLLVCTVIIAIITAGCFMFIRH